MAYRFVRWISGTLLSLFYRRITVVGGERVPAQGPLIVCANHMGSLVDPMLLLAVLDRRLRILAKAPLFREPVVGSFLRAIAALPVYRPQDRQLTPGSNTDLRRVCGEALAHGDAILLFPEGISKAETALSELRPGAARMALEAEAAAGGTLGVRILPVGIHLDQAAWFRRGRLLAEVGEPIPVAPLLDRHAADPQGAVIELTSRIALALKALIVEARSGEDLRLLRVALQAWLSERRERADPAAAAALARDFARGLKTVEQKDPGAVQHLRSAIDAYARTLEYFDLSGTEIDLRYTLGTVTRFVLREGAVLAALAPFGIAGIASNWIPYRLTGIVAGRMSETEDAWASVKLVVALVLFPLTWLLVAIAVGIAAGPGWGALAFVLGPLSGLLAIRFRDQQERVRRHVRAALLLAGGGGLKRHLSESRRGIHDQVERLRAQLEELPYNRSQTDPPPKEAT